MQRLQRLQRPSSHRGFTLIELLIALAILLVGLVALWRLHSMAIVNSANSHRLGIATILAEDALASLSNGVYAYDSSTASITIDPALDPANCEGSGFPAVMVDGLEDLPCFVDGGNRVNGMASTNTVLGPTTFLRSYHVTDAMGDAAPNVGSALTNTAHPTLLIRVRVTYFEPNTRKRHGVTIGGIRTADRYNPLNPPGT